jgi:hypothetical protein
MIMPLEVDLEVAALKGAAKIIFQLEAAERADRHRMAVERKAVAALILGLVHGHVGLDEQVLDIRSILRIQRDAVARRHHVAMAAAVERLAERLADTVGHRGGLRLIGKAGEQHHEFIAAQACYP